MEKTIQKVVSGVTTLKRDGTNSSEGCDMAEILNDQFASAFTREDHSNMPSKGKSVFTREDHSNMPSMGNTSLHQPSPGKTTATCPPWGTPVCISLHQGRPQQHALHGEISLHQGRPQQHALHGEISLHQGRPQQHALNGEISLHQGRPQQHALHGKISLHQGRPQQHALHGEISLHQGRQQQHALHGEHQFASAFTREDQNNMPSMGNTSLQQPSPGETTATCLPWGNQPSPGKTTATCPPWGTPVCISLHQGRPQQHALHGEHQFASAFTREDHSNMPSMGNTSLHQLSQGKTTATCPPWGTPVCISLHQGRLQQHALHGEHQFASAFTRGDHSNMPSMGNTSLHQPSPGKTTATCPAWGTPVCISLHQGRPQQHALHGEISLPQTRTQQHALHGEQLKI